MAAPALCAFVAHTRERLASVTMRRAALVLVLEGDKELVVSGRRLRFAAGAAIALPAGWRGEVVNDPDDTTGVYRALCLDFPAELILRTHRAHPDWVGRTLPLERRMRARLDAVLAGAVHHFAEGLALPDLPPQLLEHRAMEVLLALVGQGALPLQPHAGAVLASEAVSRLVSWDPERDWTADALAAELGLSNATLRRPAGRRGHLPSPGPGGHAHDAGRDPDAGRCADGARGGTGDRLCVALAVRPPVQGRAGRAARQHSAARGRLSVAEPKVSVAARPPARQHS